MKFGRSFGAFVVFNLTITGNTPISAARTDDITAVASRASDDYIRERSLDGKLKPERYVFGNGGTWSGAMKDFSMDKLSFLDVAHMIALPLASQSYIPSTDPKLTKLLIMVYWGTTHAPEHANDSTTYQLVQNLQGQYLAASTLAGGIPGISNSNRGGHGPEKIVADQLREQMMVALDSVKAEDALRDKDDELNVMMLGYDSWWEGTQRYKDSPLEYHRQDLLDEIEWNRYFVVLMAYDFPILWKQKKHKLLWETRFSVRQLHHEFDKDLPAMALYASQFFGKDTHGLIHTTVPFGHVDIGEVKALGSVTEK